MCIYIFIYIYIVYIESVMFDPFSGSQTLIPEKKYNHTISNAPAHAVVEIGTVALWLTSK